MSDIQSDLSLASQRATELKNATDALSQVSSVATDNQTTVNGNTKAHEVIEKAQSSSQSIVDAIIAASDNLKSVATEFEAADKKVEQVFQQPLDLLR